MFGGIYSISFGPTTSVFPPILTRQRPLTTNVNCSFSWLRGGTEHPFLHSIHEIITFPFQASLRMNLSLIRSSGISSHLKCCIMSIIGLSSLIIGFHHREVATCKYGCRLQVAGCKLQVAG